MNVWRRVVAELITMPFYAVRVGRQTGVFNSWDGCKAQVNQFPKAKYKKFSSLEEAELFVKGDNERSFVPELPKTSSVVSRTKSAGSDLEHKVADLSTALKKAKSEIRSLKKTVHSLQKDSTRQTDNNLMRQSNGKQLKRLQDHAASGGEKRRRTTRTGAEEVQRLNTTNEPVIVYTDGSCCNNGFRGAQAGIGVYWGPNHEWNVGERCTGRQTNNRAEICAAIKAVQQAKSGGIQNLVIKTDSRFLIDCVTKWCKTWQRNGWKLSSGGSVINQLELQELLQELEDSNICVQWSHVRGHVGEAGNEAADRLANEGAAKPLQ